ncbi:MAG: M48 metallopeptidase family protein [Anaerolineae bacterium]
MLKKLLADTTKEKASQSSRKVQPAGDVPEEYTRGGFTIRVLRSARRQRTVSARLLNWQLVEVRAPAKLPDSELAEIITHLIEGIKNKQRRQRLLATDHDLQARAEELNKRYFKGTLRWRSIAYVSNQAQRYGSCTPQQGTIRISERLKQVPPWVLDYVLVHELAHLQEPGHSAAFWQLVNRYDKAERARGYLMALQFVEDEPDSA